MFNNFFKTAFRNITRHKGFSFINIAGLTLGLTACILIGLFVWDENQYDKFLPGGNQVYRVYDEYTNHDGTQELAVSAPMFAVTLQQDFPEVEKTARVMMLPPNKTLFESGNKKLYEESGYYVDSTFFDVFPLSIKYGTSIKALDGISSIVLSQEMAERFFGNTDPVGKQILMDKVPYQIKAVFEKNPKFHLQFNYLLSLAAAQIPPERMQSWGWHQFYNYVKVKKGTNITALQSKFQTDVKQKSKTFQNDATSSDKPFFQPLKNIHLYSADFKFDAAQRGNITYVNALTIIAIFILLIACFNFINLATAKSLQRAREVGVRKSIGANRKQLMFQFIGETVLFSFVSVIISILLAMLLLPWLNNFTGKNISFELFINPVVVLLLIALTIIVGVIAGFYPALVLSGFKPVKVLKGNISGDETPGKIPWLRHSLVIIQFALSVLLIISAVVVFNQVNYLHNKNLGFNKEQIMFFPMRGDNMFKNVDAFKNELKELPGVSSVSIGYGFPGDAVAGDNIIVPHNGENVSQSATQLMVDYDYIKTLGLQIVAGRDFSKAMQTDKDHAWIINETAVKQMGFGTPQNALGKDLNWHPWNATNSDSLKTGKIIGVVKDFNYKSLYDKVETTVLQIYPDAAWKVAIKMNTAGIGNTIGSIKNVWSKFSPEYPIEYKFLDENFEDMYKAEDKLKSLLWIFTTIAIFVGCLGLFGLAAYTAERRKKEVGIRKVLGASTQGVVLLLSKDFIKLVVISLLIASPVAWYFMNKWLQDFAYRINISWWVFVITAIVALSLAFITVSFQAIKAAIANPIKSLRTE
jgi:putative ABC transport system permease protein